jgi:hypothetical protein
MEQQFDITIDLSNKYDDIKKLSKQKCQDLLDNIDIKEAIKNQNKMLVLNYISINYAINSNKALEQLNRNNVLKLGIDSKNKFVINILDFLLKKCQTKDIKKDIAYFQSKRNLAYLSEDIYNLSQVIRKEIKNSNHSLLRNLLFIVDKNFFTRNEYGEVLDISVEDLSEICSTLIYLYFQIHGENIISEKTFSYTDEDIEEMELLINYQFYIKKFQDVEKLIENFNYKCTRNKNNIIIEAHNELLEKSRQHGYNHSVKQRQIDAVENYKILQSKKNISLHYLINDLLNNYKNNIFKFVQEPIERYTFDLQFIFEKVQNIIQQNSFYFTEEIVEIDEIIREYFDNEIKTTNEIDEVINFRISKNLTLKDLLIVKRVFIIIGLLNSKFLYSIIKKDPSKKDVAYNSWIKVFKHEDLKNILHPFLGEKKAEEFITKFHWSLNKKGRLDLQYTPLIKSDNYYFPMNIFINSNLFRNSLFKNVIRPQNVKQIDTISNNIVSVLEQNFQYIHKEIKFKKGKQVEGDFDVIAYIDNIIYLFECKNIINPGDLHELRTTYRDNIIGKKKGFVQLSKSKKKLNSKNYIRELNNRLKWNISDDFKIVTCLVLGTRMFNGYTNGEHHIRADKELLNFLQNGTVKVYNNNKEIELRLWENNKIMGNDIFNFIENSILHEIEFSCFSPKENKLSFGKNNLIFKTFEFNGKELNKKFIDRFEEME